MQIFRWIITVFLICAIMEPNHMFEALSCYFCKSIYPDRSCADPLDTSNVLKRTCLFKNPVCIIITTVENDMIKSYKRTCAGAFDQPVSSCEFLLQNTLYGGKCYACIKELCNSRRIADIHYGPTSPTQQNPNKSAISCLSLLLGSIAVVILFLN